MSGDDVRTARLRGRRAAHGLILVVASLFIGASTVQIVCAVFGIRTAPMTSGAIDSPARRCAVGISRLARALGRAPPPPTATRGLPPDVQDAADAWGAAEGVQRSCSEAPGGLDAWAALLRLREARSQLAQSGPDDLLPLRRRVEAVLPADLR